MQLKLRRSKMYSYYLREMKFVTTCNKYLWKFVIYILIMILAVILSFMLQLLFSKRFETQQRTRYTTDLKYILMWNQQRHTKYFTNRNQKYFTGQDLFINQKCKFINCYITYNRSLLASDEFDGIVFDLGDLRKFPKNFNFTRSPFQRYIFKSLQPSERFPICNPTFDDFFNWTWTYKLNSDIPHPFIKIYDTNKTVIGPKVNVKWIAKMDHSDIYKNNVKSKTKAVAWFVSQCKLKEKHKKFFAAFKSELKGYNYSVDIFGPCGRKYSDGKFQQYARDYFFELVVEDAIAEDYVSDKILKTLKCVTVPIVLGGANYTRFLPPGSYINVKAFDIKQLGALIDYLIKRPNMYEYFLDWKTYYYYAMNPANQVCDLCEKLNTDFSMSTYPNFRLWWKFDYKENCEIIKLYNMFN